MRTIGKRWPVGIGPDRQALCSYCGVQWRRSQLTRDASGNLACPDDAPGLDIVSLSEGNARLMRSQSPRDIGPIDGGFDHFVCPPSPGFVDPNGPPPNYPNQGPTGPLSVLVNQWLRGDSVELASSGVQRWLDRSSRNNDAYAPDDASRPSWLAEDPTLSGNPTLTGDGANHWLRVTPTFNGANPMWIWMILKVSDSGFYTPLNYGPRLLEGFTFGALRFQTNTGTSLENAGAPINTWARLIFRFNIAGTDSLTVRGTTVTQASGGSRVQAAPSLFASTAGANKLQGSMAELVVTEGAPTAAEIADIEAYGVARYGGGLFA